MAPLSNELSGVLLPHDYYGTHLDGSNETRDEELELKNFEYAGNTLAQIWSNVVIDNYPVEAEYITPEEQETIKNDCETAWYFNHVQESQYFLQIVKCNDVNCCGPWRSSIKQILSTGFLPPPAPLKQSSSGLLI